MWETKPPPPPPVSPLPNSSFVLLWRTDGERTPRPLWHFSLLAVIFCLRICQTVWLWISAPSLRGFRGLSAQSSKPHCKKRSILILSGLPVRKGQGKPDSKSKVTGVTETFKKFRCEKSWWGWCPVPANCRYNLCFGENPLLWSYQHTVGMFMHSHLFTEFLSPSQEPDY